MTEEKRKYQFDVYIGLRTNNGFTMSLMYGRESRTGCCPVTGGESAASAVANTYKHFLNKIPSIVLKNVIYPLVLIVRYFRLTFPINS